KAPPSVGIFSRPSHSTRNQWRYTGSNTRRANSRMCSERPHSSTSLNLGSASVGSAPVFGPGTSPRVAGLTQARGSAGGPKGEPPGARSAGLQRSGREGDVRLPRLTCRQHRAPTARGTGFGHGDGRRSVQLEPAADAVDDAPRSGTERRLGDV